MTTEQVRKLYDGQPFRPFSFHLADGREIPVPHRDFMYITPPGRTVIVSDDDGAVKIIDLLLVTDIRIENGNKRRKR